MKRGVALVVLLAVVCVPLLLLSGCGKKPQPGVRPIPPGESRPATTAPTGGPAPTIEIQANPSSVQRGQQTTLSWQSQNAASVVIDGGVGNVSETGSIVITPRESTTFTATAKGPGGETKASTRVTVVGPQGPGEIGVDDLEQAIRDGRIKDVFFDYDKSDLRQEAKATLEQNARWMRQYPRSVVVIEGHCDERGTEEYNLALGDRRAQSTKEYLVQLGVSPEQIETISLGEEQPFAPGHDEASYAQNRRAHFTTRR